jgi:hypothetical protein
MNKKETDLKMKMREAINRLKEKMLINNNKKVVIKKEDINEDYIKGMTLMNKFDENKDI